MMQATGSTLYRYIQPAQSVIRYDPECKNLTLLSFELSDTKLSMSIMDNVKSNVMYITINIPTNNTNTNTTTEPVTETFSSYRSYSGYRK
jgi:hypothetical protein